MPSVEAVRRTQGAVEQNRRSSGRQIRTSISRPTNYYARPFGGPARAEEPDDDEPPGFFPAIQYFTDAVAALPKEVQRHVTLSKEAEAKIHDPMQEMVRIADRITALPSPPRRQEHGSQQGFLSFTANNSSGPNSAAVSLLNGSAPGLVPMSVTEAVNQLNQPTEAEQQAELQRRQEFYNLRLVISQVLAHLDEKNVCLTDANRTLDKQLSRMDKVMPYVHKEISEEARLGSITHWAYADNRKKNIQPAAPEKSRRDVAATSSLAAAAAAIHEGDIAAARSGKESKKSKAQHVDSEFEERAPVKKSHHKAKKPADAPSESKGSGSAGGSIQVPKKRKAESKVGGVGLERTASAAKHSKATTSAAARSTPAAAEPVKKKSKPTVPPLSKKKSTNVGSPMPSPRAAASPIMTTSLANELNGARPSSSRMRQGSSTLAHSKLAREESTASDKRTNGSTKAAPPSDAMEGIEPSNPKPLSRRDTAEDIKTEVAPSRDGIEMVRTRSNGVRPEPHTAGSSSTKSSSEAGGVGATKSRERSHGRHGSSQHILKQIASFNRSPTSGRRELPSGTGTGTGSESSANEEEGPGGRAKRLMRRQESRLRSGDEEEKDEVEDEEKREMEIDGPPEEEEEEDQAVVDGELDGDGEGEVDGEEPKYCYCGRESYGVMIGCENEECPREWFHIGCTGLAKPPPEDVKWYCDYCDPAKKKRSKSGRH